MVPSLKCRSNTRCGLLCFFFLDLSPQIFLDCLASQPVKWHVGEDNTAIVSEQDDSRRAWSDGVRFENCRSLEVLPLTISFNRFFGPKTVFFLIHPHRCIARHCRNPFVLPGGSGRSQWDSFRIVKEGTCSLKSTHKAQE